MAKRLPSFGNQSYRSRICNVNVGGTRANPVHCDEPAITHVLWTPNMPASFLCKEHDRQILSKYGCHQEHSLGSDCGMPGAFWDCKDNKCRVEDDLELTTDIEELEELLV
jgi:hypothetical protein